MLAQELAARPHGENWAFWVGFGLFVVVLLVLDLKVFHRKPHEVTTKEALGWSVFWVGLALVFNAAVYFWLGPERATEFLTAYVIEKSLSVDNLFVFVVLFRYFRVPGELQHRVLFFGVLGAIVMRLVFILVGAGLLLHFHWMTYVFGGFLILTGGKLLLPGHDEPDPSKNIALRVAKRFLPFTDRYEGSALFVRAPSADGSAGAGLMRYGTPLLLVLIVIEATDLVFAVDSVPACLAVSSDPFIVFTSNIFAILGLRALYFLLARFLGALRFLKYGLAVVLAFVGVKMVLQGMGHEIETLVSLAVIAGVLAVAAGASWMFPAKEPEAPADA